MIDQKGKITVISRSKIMNINNFNLDFYYPDQFFFLLQITINNEISSIYYPIEETEHRDGIQ